MVTSALQRDMSMVQYRLGFCSPNHKMSYHQILLSLEAIRYLIFDWPLGSSAVEVPGKFQCHIPVLLLKLAALRLCKDRAPVMLVSHIICTTVIITCRRCMSSYLCMFIWELFPHFPLVSAIWVHALPSLWSSGFQSPFLMNKVILWLSVFYIHLDKEVELRRMLFCKIFTS